MATVPSLAFIPRLKRPPLLLSSAAPLRKLPGQESETRQVGAASPDVKDRVPPEYLFVYEIQSHTSKSIFLNQSGFGILVLTKQ